MAKNLSLSCVDTISLPVPVGTASEDPVLAGTTPSATAGIRGVALTDIGGGLPANPAGYATVSTKGSYRVLVDTTAVALAIGDPVYYNLAGNILTSDNTDVFWGYALEALAITSNEVIDVVISPNV